MQLNFVSVSPMGTIVSDPRDNQRYVLVPYQFAQQMFRNSKYLMDFDAEYRVQELLPADEFVSLEAVSTKADLPYKVFIGVRGEAEDQVSYILQEESLDDEPAYRILYVMEEVDVDEIETFNAVVRGKVPKGYAERAVMYQKMIEEAQMQETLLQLESMVRLGLISEEEIMKQLVEKFGAEDRDESERMTRVEAELLANKVSDMLEPYADFVEVCGSYRRGREDPGDLDVVIILKEGITLPEIVADLEGNYEKYNWLGEKKTQLVIDGVKVDIKVSTPTGIGAALLYFTGPSGYNIGMRSAAKRKGLKLNEYGLFDRDTNEYLGGATEEEIYDLLGRTYKPPEMRAEQSFQADYVKGEVDGARARTEPLRAALIGGLKRLAKDGYVVAAPPYGNKSQKFYRDLSSIMMEELAKLETGTTGPTVSGTGVVQSPLDVVAALARGEPMSKTPTASATSEPSVLGVAEMVSSFTKQATMVDKKAGKDYDRQPFDIPSGTIKRLAWPIARAMGIYCRANDENYTLYSTPQKNINCSMIVNLLVEDVAPEVKGLTYNEKAAFYQEFGNAIKSSVFANTKDESALVEERERQEEWCNRKYGGVRSTVEQMPATQKIKDKAQTAAKKLNPFASEEGSAPIQRPMEFGEPVNWTPLDGTPSLKRRRDAEEKLSKTSCCCGATKSNPCVCMKAPEPMSCSAIEPKCACYKALAKGAESSVSSDADLFWLWMSDENLVFHRNLARIYRSKNFGFIRDANARSPRQFSFSYLGYNDGDITMLRQPILSFEEKNNDGLENISFQLAEYLLNWIEMAADDVGMEDWKSEDMVVAVDLGNTYSEDFIYLIFPDGSEMQIETFNVEKGFPKDSGSFPDLSLAPIPSRKLENGSTLVWNGELKVVSINDRSPYSFMDGQV
jgi:DNA polymerase/3'-5' exonuclease PolX